MPRFDLIFVDFYGTVSAGDREAVESVCARVVEDFGLSLSPSAFAVRWGEHFFASLDRCNGPDFRTLHECVCASLSRTLVGFEHVIDAPAYVEELVAYWANPPIYSDAIEFLRHVNLPTCCVSNADTAPLLAAVERHSLPFTRVVTSEMARSYKPHAEIFHHAAETMEAVQRLAADPKRILHVGDSLHADVGGAAALGLTTVWLHRDSRTHDIGRAQPDHTIHSLDELLDLLAQGPHLA